MTQHRDPQGRYTHGERSARVLVSVPAEMLASWRAEARRRGITVSELIRQAVARVAKVKVT